MRPRSLRFIKQLFIAVYTVIGLACVQTAIAQVQEPTNGDPNWRVDYEPFQIAGNLYYVGTYDLGCYLITTPKGHILINTGLAASQELIQKHVEQLGYKMSDIKILLTNQAHFDHLGAMAAIKKLTGATLMVDEGDVEVVEKGSETDYVFRGHPNMFEPIKVDRVLHNGDKIELGGATLTMLHHPGHTRGSCSFMFTTLHNGKTYKVLIANMPKMLPEVNPSGMPGYPNVGKDFEYTYAQMPKLEFDIWVAAHASQFGLHEKRKPGDKCNPEVFRDRKRYDKNIKTLKQEYLDKKNSKS